MQPETSLSTRETRPYLTGVLVFVVLAVAGVFYAKWDPYYGKLLTVAATHTLGPSIVTGTARTAPPVGVQAALSYFVSYFKAIWVALVVGLVIGAGVQTLIPERWLLTVLGRGGFQSAAVAAAAAVPSMMCTCCSAPVAVSLGKKGVSTGAVLAYWVGNPVLNPATIVFMGFVLGWHWAVLRIVMGLVLVMGAVYIGNRWGRSAEAAAVLDRLDAATTEAGSRVTLFFRTLLRLAITLLPEYVIIVGVLGAVRAWLFPAITPAVGGSLWLALGLAVAGALFVIPTAGEIPIVQSLMTYGLGRTGAGALMMTLPAVSLPSLAMVSQAVPRGVLVRLLVWVIVLGLVTGLLAGAIL
jgi:uncharacterized membrane protein YraQ (UPF0718 family)